ncbi:MAG: hypothetical protein M3Q07_28720 [Pseudobdellovibrionaceae bacterium]|nr:hypothetical protein [Pseudobdellovibrionaceae bacterium]
MATHNFSGADHFILYLDGGPTVLKGFEGGNIKGAVETVATGLDDLPTKNISALELEPIVIQAGISMGKSLREWIGATLDQTDMRKSGYVVAGNADYEATALRHFRDALITEITIPALDAASKDGSYFTIKFDPEEITYKDGDKSALTGVVNARQKQWLCSGFRMRLGDLPCTRVSKIDAFTIKQHIVPETSGDFRVSTRKVTKLEIPNLKITFSAADIKPWTAWFDEFVVKGRNSQDKELTGIIEFLDPSGTEVLGAIDLLQVGIFSLSVEKAEEAHAAGESRYVAELYAENMGINFTSAR